MARLKDHLNHSGARTGYCAWTTPGRASCRAADRGTNADLHGIRSMAEVAVLVAPQLAVRGWSGCI